VDAYADSKAFAANTYAYYVMLPELSAGAQEITMPVADGKTATGSVKLTVFNKIAEVDLYIKNQQDNALKEVTDAKAANDAQVQSGNLRPSTRDSLNAFLQQSYNKNKAIVDALPAEEKRTYAQLIDANKSWLNDFKQVFINNPLSNYRENTQGDCEELRRQQKIYWDNGDIGNANDLRVEADQCEADREKQRLDASKVFTGKMKEAFNAANEERKNTNGRAKAAWAFVSTFVTEASKGLFETVTGVKDVDDPFAVLEIDDTQQQRITAQEFELDKEYVYSAGLQLVNLGSQNTAAFPAFAGIIDGINSYNAAMTDLGQFLPYVPELKVPVAKNEKLYVSGYTVDQVSDNRVSVEFRDGAKGKLIKVGLKTPIVETVINFTFRVNYTSNYGNGSKQIQATLNIPLDKMLVRASPLTITTWVEGGVDLFTMHEYWRWKCGTTEYVNKDQLLSASISFADGGTCNVTEKYHEIYYDNPGTTCATVRKVDQEKTYSTTSTWSADNATKMITVTFKDEQGQDKTLTAPAVIQNGVLTVSGGGATLAMKKL
ncbi:MAG TPA: hypothetical protein VJ499_02645, partial [Flavisolibacter sp.]|nr:hypothetical protein [Flavisolibacter sp.]